MAFPVAGLGDWAPTGSERESRRREPLSKTSGLGTLGQGWLPECPKRPVSGPVRRPRASAETRPACRGRRPPGKGSRCHRRPVRPSPRRSPTSSSRSTTLLASRCSESASGRVTSHPDGDMSWTRAFTSTRRRSCDALALASTVGRSVTLPGCAANGARRGVVTVSRRRQTATQGWPPGRGSPLVPTTCASGGDPHPRCRYHGWQVRQGCGAR